MNLIGAKQPSRKFIFQNFGCMIKNIIAKNTDIIIQFHVIIMIINIQVL